MAPSLASPPPSPRAESVDLECGLGAPPSRAERRQLERDLVLAFDSRELRRHEAWFLVDTAWLDAWMSYVLGDPDDADAPARPGPLTNDALFDREEFRLRAGLQQTRDYRGVNPQVYALYAELYGTDGARPIVRWTLDLYAVPVMIDDVREMQRAPELKARALVQELNEQLDVQRKGLEALRPPQEDDESWTYRCLCRCEFLVPFLYRVLGGGPTYTREKQTSWSELLCCCCAKRKKRSKRRRSKGKRGRKDRSRSREEEEEEETSSDEDETSSDEETHGLLG
ncbi:Peptidase C19, ubiquitin-specific peptidase, DUSP domain [Phytophthora cinnamomi]|uniref:Peptidase C19, ubiquitin-specific peptidase, DUSP domain n=1 Tax=Phytophthora cinnamomi TaxID=4785 RepID=UPI00355A533C|nr:Peptidase C19, ubiquitin-specific peptidase, DUSP domain [Phytophthora cinnamomi]